MEISTFAKVLEWILGGGCVALTYWAMNNVPFLVALNADWRRYLSVAIAYLLAALAFGLQVAFALQPLPPDALAWLDKAVWLGGIVFTASQVVHGALVLHKVKRVATV